MATSTEKGTAAADASGRSTQREARELRERGTTALVGKPGLHDWQPSAGFGSHGFTSQEDGPERVRDGLGGDGVQQAPQFLGEPGSGVEAGRSRVGCLLYQPRDALNLEIHRCLSASGRGLDLDVFLHRTHAGHLSDFLHDGVEPLSRAHGAGEYRAAIDDLDVDAVVSLQVVAGQPAHDERRGLGVGVEAFGFVEGLRREGRKQSEGKEEREQQASNWEAEGRHDRGSPGKRPLGARGILRNPLNARHSQMGMDDNDNAGQKPWRG